MNVFKVIKDSNYTTINNTALKDKSLSLKAKGFLALICSLPPTWDFSVRGMQEILKEGRDAIYSTIDELIEAGYCQRKQLNGSGGFSAYEYNFFEVPQTTSTHTDFPHTPNTNTDFPHTASTHTPNQQQLNTNSNNDLLNKENIELSNKEENIEASDFVFANDLDKIIPTIEPQKEKEKSCAKKEKEMQALEVLEHLNKMAGKRYTATKTNLNFITARLGEGNSVIDLKRVIELKTHEWSKDPKMNTYLRPETLFNATKFQTYIQQVQRVIENPQQFVNEQRTNNNGANRNRPDSAENIASMFSHIDSAFGS